MFLNFCTGKAKLASVPTGGAVSVSAAAAPAAAEEAKGKVYFCNNSYSFNPTILNFVLFL